MNTNKCNPVILNEVKNLSSCHPERCEESALVRFFTSLCFVQNDNAWLA